MNIRFSTKDALPLIKGLTPDQCRGFLDETGFSSLLDMDLDNGLGARTMVAWLYDHIDPTNMVLNVGPGKTLKITKKSGRESTWSSSYRRVPATIALAGTKSEQLRTRGDNWG